MRKLSEEMRKSGKRGSSLKLKRVLEEEKDDGSRKKTKKTQKNKHDKPETTSSAKTNTSRATKLNDLKLKELEAFAGIQQRPVQSPSKHYPVNPPSALSSENQRKTPVKSPRKTPVKKSPVKFPRTPVKETPVKSPRRTPVKSPRKTPVKSPRRTPVKETPVKSPRKITVQSHKKTQFKTVESPSKNLESPPAVETSFIIGQGLGILNEDTSMNFALDNGIETENMLDPSFPEYGYNAANATPCFQTRTTQGGSSNFSILSDPSPLDNLTGYYRGLHYDQQCQILSFLNVLTNTLQKYTYGTNYAPILGTPGPSSDPSCSQDATPSVETPTVKEPRLLPLINDENNTFGDVLVNPSNLRTAEMKALTTSTTKNGGIYLQNKVVEMVFKKEELCKSKGLKGLDQHKSEAIQEYMHSKCKKLQLDPVPPKIFNKTIQNKIGNIRHETKGKTSLVGKKGATKSSSTKSTDSQQNNPEQSEKQ